MVFNKNFKQRGSNGGFTIVELLVVIVVIAILAAITIVSYVGITARANTAKNLSNAQSVQSVAEAMNADNTFYPALVVGTQAQFGLTGGSQTTKLPSGVTVIPDAATEVITGSANTNSISYSCLTTCTSSTGGRIGYWDYGTPGGSSASIKYIYVGAAASGSTWAYPAS